MAAEPAQSADSDQFYPFENRIEKPPALDFPDRWTLSESWQRAQTERDNGGPAIHPHVRFVWLSESDSPHRVVFVLDGATLRAECDCESFQHRNFCAHIASLWWQWVRGRIAVYHIQTGEFHQTPPSWLRFGIDRDENESLTGLSPKMLDAFLNCEMGDCGVREFARIRQKAPGTIGNQLREARERVARQQGGRV